MKLQICRAIATFALLPALLLPTGCSAFRPMNQTVNIVAWPEDSALTVNGKSYHPPTQISVRRDQQVAIQCFKDGYVPYNHTIGTHLSGSAALDIVGTIFFLFPIIGLIAPGAHSLDQTDVNITLYLRGTQPPPEVAPEKPKTVEAIHHR